MSLITPVNEMQNVKLHYIGIVVLILVTSHDIEAPYSLMNVESSARFPPNAKYSGKQLSGRRPPMTSCSNYVNQISSSHSAKVALPCGSSLTLATCNIAEIQRIKQSSITMGPVSSPDRTQVWKEV